MAVRRAAVGKLTLKVSVTVPHSHFYHAPVARFFYEPFHWDDDDDVSWKNLRETETGRDRGMQFKIRTDFSRSFIISRSNLLINVCDIILHCYILFCIRSSNWKEQMKSIKMWDVWKYEWKNMSLNISLCRLKAWLILFRLQMKYKVTKFYISSLLIQFY